MSPIEENNPDSPRRRGRPPRREGPSLPHADVDRLLVFGELVPCADGSDRKTVFYPSYRNIAKRYGVSASLVSAFSKKHDCMRRRKRALARVEEKVDQKLTQMRVNAVTVTRQDELRIVDNCILRFEQAILEDRIRCNSLADLNTVLRLKEFLKGGPDARKEIQEGINLADLQARHERMLRIIEGRDTSEGLPAKNKRH